MNELESLLQDEQLANCPILILGNKIDKHGAAGEQELKQYFKLFGKTTGQVCVCLCVTTQNSGDTKKKLHFDYLL